MRPDSMALPRLERAGLRPWLLATALFASFSAHGSLVATASASASNYDTSVVPTWHNVLSQQTTSSTATAAATSTRLNGTTGLVSSQSHASVDYGVLKIDGTVHTNFANDGQATARANAKFDDSMIVTLDGIANGTWATMRLQTQFDWSLDGALSGAGARVDGVLQMFLWARASLADPVSMTHRRDSYELTLSGGEVRTARKTGPDLGSSGLAMDPLMPDPDNLYLDVQFRLGWDEVTFGMELNGFARGARGNTDGHFLANHSAYWSGITSIMVDGVSYSNFNLQSRSGTDWRRSFIPDEPASVPTPATLALVCLALVGCASTRRSSHLAAQRNRAQFLAH